MTRSILYERCRFAPGTKVLAPMRKVPVAYAPAVVDKVQSEGVCVAMLHPKRPNFIYQVFKPDDLVLLPT